MENLLIVSVSLLVLTSVLAGVFAVSAYEKNAKIRDLEQSCEFYRNRLLAELTDANIKTETERKLWVNKALVRGGGQKIFENDVRTRNSGDETRKDADENATDELLAPFTGQIQAWRTEDEKGKKKTLKVDFPLTPMNLPEAVQNDLINAIDEIANQ